jgi:hypothetical protein
MPRYVRTNRCGRSFTRHVGFAHTLFSGVGATLLLGPGNLGMARCVRVKMDWQE